MNALDLTDSHVIALRFLERGGPHCIGVIDDENKLAAALLFDELNRAGLTGAVIGEQGPIYRISLKGRDALERLTAET